MIDLGTVDFDGLSHEDTFPAMVPGRTVHIDADFIAYEISYEREDDPKTIDDMQHNAEMIIELKRKRAAAEFVHVHLTPSSSNKGGRYGFAIQKPYQGNRDDKPKPRLLHIMRQWLADRYPSTRHQFCEADDGMSSQQYAAIAAGRTDLSIICSGDKDLRMVPGWHTDWITGDLTFVDPDKPFGWVELHETKTALGAVTKKLKGFGHKWFWAQMLVGDTADHIQGLPKVAGSFMNSIKPTAPVQKAMETLKNADATEKQRLSAVKIMNERKPALCGPSTAILLLDLVNDNASAFQLMKALYEAHEKQVEPFRHHQTGDIVPWQQVFISEARLLWMRVEPTNPDCVLNFFKELP